MKRSLTLLLALCILLSSQVISFAYGEAVDVSLYQPAKASSEVDADHPANLANDGINDNESYTWWMSKTDDKSAWWQVDLGLSYKLSSIELEAKFGSADAERKNIRILASKTEDFSDMTELAVIGDEGYSDVYSLEINKKEQFRFIKVEKTDSAALSIGDIHIYANQKEILQGAEAVSIAGQIPATDEEGRYIIPLDVIGTKYEKAVGLLSALNIMRGYPDGDFMPNEYITRAEFSTVITRLLGGEWKKSSRTFIDVTPEHWAYNSIETAAALGIVKGVEEGIFAPDTKVTAPQVIKMLVSVLGYGELAEKSGGYPYGYQEVANSLGLYKDVSLSNSEVISRGEIAILVYNALDCDIMRLTSFGDFQESNAYKGETILTEYLDIIKGKGIVNAVRGTSLTGVNKKTDNGYIEIDGVPYYSEIPNLESYLGYYVEYYYTGEDSSAEIVAIVVSTKNDVIQISASELIDIKDSILIYGKEDEEEAELSDDMDVLYNGVALRVYEYEELLPSEGQVILIDNNGDGVYDVYIVYEVKNYVVSWVNINKNTVYTKDAKGSIKLNPEEARVSVTYKATGENISLDRISEWNILSVMESVNESGEKALNVIVSDEFIRGSLELKAKDYVVIAGRTVKVADGFDLKTLELGAKGYFYLDAFDKLAAFNGDVTPGEQYGFLRDAKYDAKSVGDEISFRILTKEGKFETLIASEKFKLNGKDVTDKSSVETILESTGINNTKAQVIHFVVNASGLITKMETTKGALTLNYSPEDSIGTPPKSDNGYYLNAAEIFDALFAYDAETLMVKLPPSGNLEIEKDYKVLTSSDLSKTEYYKSLKVYDVDEQNIAGMILFTSGGGQNAGNSYNLFLVDELEYALNDEGDVLYNVKGIYNGTEKSYFIDESVKVNASDFERGSVLTLAFTGELITDYEVKLYKTQKPEDASDLSVSVLPKECQDTISSTGIMGKCFLGYGTVTSKKDGVITITFDGNNEEAGATYDHLLVRTSSLGRIYRFDKEQKEVYVSNANEILDAQTVGTQDASKVLITADSGNMRQLIILN